MDVRIALLEDERRAALQALLASEQRFHQLVDAVTDYAIFLLDATGHVATWNEGAKRIKGYDAAEIVGEHFSIFYTAEDRAAGKPEQVLQTVRDQGRFEQEAWRERRDGTRFWANVVITALRDVQGDITGFAKVTRDLTIRRAAEESERRLAAERLARESAEAERNRLLGLFAQLPASVNLLRGPDLVFELVHPTAVEALGGRDLIGKPLMEAIPEYRDQPEIVARIRRVYDTGEPSTFHEFPVRLQRGGIETLSYWSSIHLPVRDAAGAVEGVMTFDQDVTENVLARERIERANRSLRQLTELAFALANARTPEDVGTVIVDTGMQLSQADTCVLYALDEAGTTLELVGHRGVATAIIERMQRMQESDAPESFAVLRAGTSQWAETAEEYGRLYPRVAGMKVDGRRAQAFWCVPLVVEGGPVGLLGMGFYEERRFPDEERSLIETMGRQCGQALLRALRAEREGRVRAWLATTLRSIGDAVITTDTAGRVTLMNAVAEELTGWSESQARGRPLDEVFPIFSEKTRERCENPVEKVLREGKVVGLANHTVLRSRAGVETPIDDSAAPIRDTKGALFGVVLVFRDVTAEKRHHARRDFLARAGAALTSSLDYRSTLASVAQFAVPELSDWCTVLLLEPGEAEPRQVAMAHADPAKLQFARELAERYPPDPNAPTGAHHVIRTGRSELYTVVPPALLERSARDDEHLRLIHELRLHSAMIVPLLGRERTLGALTFIHAESGRRYSEEDLTFAEEFARTAALAIENALALRQAEEARVQEQRLRREADIANKAKDDFLATVSHELRTPLNAILGWASALRRRQPPPDLDQPLAIIERNARRQARLIEDVLDISRIISGKLTLHQGPTNLSEVVQNAMESVGPAAEAKQIRIRVKLDVDVTITADGDRLQQVVWNLLSNAVKFTPHAGEVSIRTHREGSDICICVSDTGEGITSDALPVIFEPFRQADASTTRRHGGLGLGLAIVRQLVAAHGGTVRAESEGPGKGAKFVVALPAQIVVTSVPEQNIPATSSIENATAVLPSLAGLSVLVVDDEPDALDIAAHILRERGAQVTTAGSAAQALDALDRTRADVIVSDIAMPEMDGFTFIRKLRAMPAPRGGRTPALALTAYARKEDAQRAFNAGYQMHASKPIDPSQLVTMVANLAGLSLEASGPSSKGRLPG
ncbi:MAG TPA: PAS domain S-box protein [Polyangiaceae bacterium]|nr:PAS domain S-box protein [Polyangiaceae bacterium]